MSRKRNVFTWTCFFLLTFTMSAGATFTLKPSVRLEETYDSNVEFGDDDNEKDDFITSVRPRIDLIHEIKGLNLNGSYSFNSRYYSHEPALNYIGHVGSIELKMDISAMSSISVSDSAAYTKELRETEATGIQTGRTGVLSNNAGVSLSHELSRFSLVKVRGSQSLSRFDDSAFIDSRTDSAGLDLRHELTHLRAVYASYTYTKFIFEDSEQDDADAQSFEIGLSEQFSSDLSLSMSGGIVYSGEIADSYDWTAQASLVKRFQMSSVFILYSRGVTTSSGLTDEINISDRGTLTWSQIITRSLNTVLSGSYYENRSEPTGDLSQKAYDVSTKTDWRPSSWLSIGAGYSRFQQWGEGTAELDLTRDQVFVTVTAFSDSWRF